MRHMKVSKKVFDEFKSKGYYNGRTRMLKTLDKETAEYIGGSENVAKVLNYNNQLLYFAELTIKTEK